MGINAEISFTWHIQCQNCVLWQHYSWSITQTSPSYQVNKYLTQLILYKLDSNNLLRVLYMMHNHISICTMSICIYWNQILRKHEIVSMSGWANINKSVLFQIPIQAKINASMWLEKRWVRAFLLHLNVGYTLPHILQHNNDAHIRCGQ